MELVPTAVPQWRVNLHGHTTKSDGRLSPQEYIDWYAQKGYDGVAVTDHNVQTTLTTIDTRGLVLLPGAEVTASGAELGGQYHLVSVGPLPNDLPVVTTPAAHAAALLAEAGAFVIVAHPHWSGLTVADLLSVSAAHAMEIYNGGTVWDSEKGLSVAPWEEVWQRGGSLWGVATDDSHFRFPDGGLGWVMVLSEERRADAFVAALRRGAFYSSTGPRIWNITLEGRVLRVRCSPCRGVYILSFASRNTFRLWDGQVPLEDVEFVLKGHPEWLRVQVTDLEGRSAWSQPIRLG